MVKNLLFHLGEIECHPVHRINPVKEIVLDRINQIYRIHFLNVLLFIMPLSEVFHIKIRARVGGRTKIAVPTHKNPDDPVNLVQMNEAS